MGSVGISDCLALRGFCRVLGYHPSVVLSEELYYDNIGILRESLADLPYEYR